jgi:hypothetical protein
MQYAAMNCGAEGNLLSGRKTKRKNLGGSWRKDLRNSPNAHIQQGVDIIRIALGGNDIVFLQGDSALFVTVMTVAAKLCRRCV